jgi:hypothetical protein
VKPYLLFAIVTAALMSTAPAWAQVIYKSTMPDGRIIYGEKAAPGAKKVEEIIPQTGKTGVGGGATPAEKEQLQQHENARKKDEARQQDIREAEQALQNAEAARLAGKEPLPGERQGTAGGASRLDESYFERQKALDDAVKAARKRLDELKFGTSG